MYMRRSTRLRALFTTILPLVVAVVLPVSVHGQSQNELPPRGQGPEARNPEASQAIDQLWSPYCPGLMLEVCPSPGGAALRDSLQTLAEEEGYSAAQLVDWVIDNHGEEYRALPQRSGVSLLAWWIPPVAVVVGLGVIFVVLWRMRAARVAAGPREEPAELSDEEERRLRAAMQELDAEEEAPFF